MSDMNEQYENHLVGQCDKECMFCEIDREEEDNLARIFWRIKEEGVT